MDDKKILRTFIRKVIGVIILLSLAFLLSYTFLNQRTMQGHSMENTIMSGDVVFLNRTSTNFFSINRFDIICTKNRNIKRVIGLPGERIKISNGLIYVNDIILTNPYIPKINTPGLASNNIIIPENEYFVIGDNPNSSEDSRIARVGNIKQKDIDGTIWFKIFPLNHMGVVR